ncbi:MAG: hypothetical protein K2L02_01955 [Clostridia bacterium]|nr:hypothetical protein [Clostridia bacterium]
MNTKEKRLKRAFIALAIILAVFFALFIFLMIWFLGAKYPDFKSVSKEEFEIQGLKEGISPQGLSALPEDAEYDFAMSGYMVDKSPSRVYLIKSGTDEAKYFTLKTKEGKEVNSHFGGVTATKNYILIADGKKIVRVRLEDALSAENGAAVEIYDELKTDINVAFCYYYEEENLLFAGEFYREKNYKTDESHHLEKDGETNYAFIYAYNADESAFGDENNKPVSILSVRGLVQGVAVTGDKIYLSCSYGLADSKLYVYSNPLHGEGEPFNGVPLYRLDKDNLLSTLTMPCMSEEICIKDGKLYILYESLCKKYKYFVRVQTKNVFSVPLEKIGE